MSCHQDGDQQARQKTRITNNKKKKQMEKKAKIKIAITIASLAAISILFTRQQRRRRKLNQCPQYSCYLQSEPKPQHNFKRVLADNSYSPFKHANKGAFLKLYFHFIIISFITLFFFVLVFYLNPGAPFSQLLVKRSVES